MENQQERKKPEKADLAGAIITSGKDSGKDTTLNPPHFGSAGCLTAGVQELWVFKGSTYLECTFYHCIMCLHTGTAGVIFSSLQIPSSASEQNTNEIWKALMKLDYF